ncbi:MAG: rplV, partial [Acidimicrobiales bacterium]|nr:rplV [Acidimicrobiales bacterium]
MAQSANKIAAVRETRKGATIYKTNERPGTRAQVRYVRVSAYKAREVLDLIRGKHVADADEILQFVERDVAIIIRKALASAVANAVNNDSQDPEALFVSACYADEGPTLKRWRPRARGRATRIRKRTCHITIIVSRLPDLQLRLRAERDARSGRVAGGTAGAASRRARVARSRKAETHDHDHDHDHDDDEVLDTDVEIEVDQVEAPEAEAGDATDATDADATDGDVTAPTGSGEIKGNADSMKYHVPGSQWYDQTEPE